MCYHSNVTSCDTGGGGSQNPANFVRRNFWCKPLSSATTVAKVFSFCLGHFMCYYSSRLHRRILFLTEHSCETCRYMCTKFWKKVNDFCNLYYKPKPCPWLLLTSFRRWKRPGRYFRFHWNLFNFQTSQNFNFHNVE